MSIVALYGLAALTAATTAAIATVDPFVTPPRTAGGGGVNTDRTDRFSGSTTTTSQVTRRTHTGPQQIERVGGRQERRRPAEFARGAYEPAIVVRARERARARSATRTTTTTKLRRGGQQVVLLHKTKRPKKQRRFKKTLLTRIF